MSLRNPVDRLWSDFFYFAHRPNHERDLPLPHPDTEVTAEHFDAFARRAVEVFEECMQDNTVQHCAFATRTHRKYHAGRVRFAMACCKVKGWVEGAKCCRVEISSMPPVPPPPPPPPPNHPRLPWWSSRAP